MVNSNSSTAPNAAVSQKFPPQIRYIVGNEGCERYSFYGMRSILVIFMVQYLLVERAEATTIYHLFVAACYLLPLFGAYLSDRLIGRYKTILYLSLIYCVGNFVLAVWQTKIGLYTGLGLIALGSGGIKPCVSAYVGDQFTKGQEGLLKKVFDLFYFMINFGSFFATLLTPWILTAWGPKIAFGVPGVLMAIATVIFWGGRKLYRNMPLKKKDAHGLVAVVGSAWKNRKERKKEEKFLDGALKEHPNEAVEGAKAVWDIAKIFLTVSIFWALFDQHGSTWVLQAKEMKLDFMGIHILPSQMAALNPIMVMLLIPFFSFLVYPSLEKVIKVTPLRKMGAGMMITGLSFLEVAVIQYFLDRGMAVNVVWQFFPYLTITIAEVLISITGLEFAYTQAPKSMKSTIMSMWLLTVFVGNLITAYVAKVNVFEGVTFFAFFAILMFSVAGIFVFTATRYPMRNFMEGDDVEDVKKEITDKGETPEIPAWQATKQGQESNQNFTNP